MSAAKIELPPKLIPVFSSKYRYRGAHGGRGSAKTKAFAKMCAVQGYILAKAGKRGMIVCGREFMNSIADSSFSEVKWAINSEPWLSDFYEVGKNYIRTRCGSIEFKFVGLRHNLSSIKGKSEILILWVDEAEDVSEAAWVEVIPTVRTSGSEIWLTWNPRSSESATHKRFIVNPPKRCHIVELNHIDNPWFPDELEEERLHDLKHRPDIYDHIWEGAFYEITDAQVFKDKCVVEDFEVDRSFGNPYNGMDFGFAQDPTTAVQCYIKGKALYIRHERGKVGLELDDTGAYIQAIPDIEHQVIRADCARPESISYLKRHGLPRIEGVKKWPGSVEDGVSFMKSFERIVIHPSCTGTAKEFRHYSYKIDKNTGDIQPVIMDSWNHFIDAIRYALAPMIRNKTGSSILVF